MTHDVLQSYLTANERRHRDLDRLIAEEQARPAPDALRLQMLKRRRLRVKELCRVVRDQRDRLAGRLPEAA